MKDLKYKITMFKLAGHKTWRITAERDLSAIKNITEKRVIEIDRLTGEVIVTR